MAPADLPLVVVSPPSTVQALQTQMHSVWDLTTRALWRCLTLTYWVARGLATPLARYPWEQSPAALPVTTESRTPRAKVPRHACVVFTGWGHGGPQRAVNALVSGIRSLHNGGVNCVTVCNTAIAEGSTTQVLVDLLGGRLEPSLFPDTPTCVLRDGLTSTIEVLWGGEEALVMNADETVETEVGGAQETLHEDGAGGPALVVNVVGATQGADDILATVMDLVRDGEGVLSVDHMKGSCHEGVEVISRHLQATRTLPDPDLIIRCSDTQTLDGFLPWQSHLAEILFVSSDLDCEMSSNCVDVALDKFARIDSRHGR